MSINAYREVETDKTRRKHKCIAKKPGMYKWGGKEGCRLLFVFIQLLILSPVTPLRSAFVHTGKRLHPATETAGLPSGKAGGFQGNGRVACVDFGKRLVPVQERRRTGIAWGRVAATHCNMREEERRSRAGELTYRWIPLNAQLQRNCARQPTGHNRFSRFSGRGLFCPPATFGH